MIITRLQGGLGNQMFQYAAGRSLSLRNSTNLLLDVSVYGQNNFRSYGLDAFDIAADKATAEEIDRLKPKGIGFLFDAFKPIGKKRLLKEKDFAFNESILQVQSPAYLECSINGGWQSEKYFIENAEVIRKDFELKNVYNEKLRAFISKIDGVNSASLHVRRGDYLQPKHQKIYSQIPLSYYQEALAMFNPKAELFVFSDDSNWVKANLAIPSDSKITYISGEGFAPQEELFLMSRCKHSITANSTFSWWGAWLNGNPHKIVITPRQWFVDGRNESDLIPTSWIKL